MPLLIHKMQGLTFLQVVSGEGASKQPILMYVFSTLMNRSMSLTAAYKKHEREKKRAYEQRVQEVEYSSFTPLVFSATGGMGREANIFYKRPASMLSLKWDHQYSATLSWLRCRISFSLLRSSIMAIRGARSSRGHATKTPSTMGLVIKESNCFNFYNVPLSLNNPSLSFYFIIVNITCK